MSDFFSTPDDLGEIRQSDLQGSLGGRLGAEALNALDPQDSLSAAYIFRRMREENAGGGNVGVPGAGGELDVFSGQPLEERQAASDAFRAAVPDTAIADAKARVKQEGLEDHLKLPDQPSIKSPVLDLMIQEAHERRDREVAIAKGPQGFIPGALGLVTSLGAGMIDPVNMAAFSIPVLGEARMGKLLASAGDSIFARAGVRAIEGGAQGAAGTALLQPADWWLHTQDGQDYTFADALKSVAMGAGMGGVFHAGGGLIGDIAARSRGAPLPGSPEDLLLRGLMTGRHVPGGALTGEGLTADELVSTFKAAAATPPAAPSNAEIDQLIAHVESQLAPAAPPHPAEVLVDLPPAAQEDAVRSAVADVMQDQPVRAGDMLEIAADHDPRIAESFEAFHGSPHDFDQFDVSRIGTGEGAQSYGHGLYFAENEKVARGYQQATSDKAFINKVAELYDEGFSPSDAWAEIKDNWKDFTPAEQRLMTALEKDGWLGFDYPHQAVNAALRDIKAFDVSPETAAAARAMGNLYRVKINANQEHFLDWDKPISQQSPHVREALRKVADDIVARDPADAHDIMHAITADERADTFYERLADALKTMKKLAPDKNGFYTFDKGHASASRTLHEAGIPGIKYLDRGSRDLNDAYVAHPGEDGRFAVMGAGIHERFATREEAQAALDKLIREQGTRNFVVFDDKHIEITHKNGEPVKTAEPEPAAAPRLPNLAQGPKPRGRAAAHPDTLSLNEHLASKGGLKPDPELEAIYGNKRGPFVPGFGPLIRKAGMSLDEALSSAKQHGYMFDPHDVENGTAGAGGRTSHGLTPNDLLDKLDAENRGQKQYKPGHIEATKYDAEQEKHVIMGALETELEKSGQDVSAIDPKLLNRTVEIVHREGVSDVLDAYERAIMEDEERYNAISDARRANPAVADLPGFDDARAAPGDGGRDQSGGGQTGRPDQGRGGPNDPQSQSHGARAARAATDPRWRELADVRAPEDDPDTVAESKQAERLAEPASFVPESSLTAAEKAAADAEAVWKQIEPTLSEEERTAFNEAFDRLKTDAEARDTIITDGAACLAAAFV